MSGTPDALSFYVGPPVRLLALAAAFRRWMRGERAVFESKRLRTEITGQKPDSENNSHGKARSHDSNKTTANIEQNDWRTQ